MITKKCFFDFNLYLGTAREICSLYKKFNQKGIATPCFCESPKFNYERMYGLMIDYVDLDTGMLLEIPEMQVVTADTAIRLICDSVGL